VLGAVVVALQGQRGAAGFDGCFVLLLPSCELSPVASGPFFSPF
tara:strand:- start:155 stop:286 length:132 start_codon:yes stop_codon:yes gene_type:complete